MSYPLLDFVAWILAVDAIITAWFYGSIFEKKREAWAAKGGFFGELVDCPMCLTYWVAAGVGLLCWIPSHFLPEPWAHVPRFLLYGFAVVSIVHILQREHPHFTDPEETDPGQEGVLTQLDEDDETTRWARQTLQTPHIHVPEPEPVKEDVNKPATVAVANDGAGKDSVGV